MYRLDVLPNVDDSCVPRQNLQGKVPLIYSDVDTGGGIARKAAFRRYVQKLQHPFAQVMCSRIPEL